MRQTTLEAPIAVGDFEIVPVVVTSVGGHALGRSCAGFALKEPIGLLIRAFGTTSAFDLGGRSVPVEELLCRTDRARRSG